MPDINPISHTTVRHIQNGEAYHISVDTRPHKDLEAGLGSVYVKINELIDVMNNWPYNPGGGGG